MPLGLLPHHPSGSRVFYPSLLTLTLAGSSVKAVGTADERRLARFVTIDRKMAEFHEARAYRLEPGRTLAYDT